MPSDLHFLSAFDDFHFTVIFNCLPLEGKVPHDHMVAADEVFILIDAASLQCGYTSSVTFGDSFSGSNCHPLALLAGQSCVGVVNQIKDLDNTASRRSLFSKLVLN